MPDLVLLEEVSGILHTDEEIAGYAKSIGINVETEPYLLPIAREGICALLPDGWDAVMDINGNIYYTQSSTGIRMWQHPLDAIYKRSVIEERLKHSDAPEKPLPNPPISSIFETATCRRWDSSPALNLKNESFSSSMKLPASRRRQSSKMLDTLNSPNTSRLRGRLIPKARDLDHENLLEAERLLSSLHKKVREFRNLSSVASSPDYAVNSNTKRRSDSPILPCSPKMIESPEKPLSIKDDYHPQFNFPRLQTSPSSIDDADHCNDRVLKDRNTNSDSFVKPRFAKQGDGLENKPPKGVFVENSLEYNVDLKDGAQRKHHKGRVTHSTSETDSSLHYLLEERNRIQNKLNYLKLTGKAYRLRVAAIDSNIRMLRSLTLSSSPGCSSLESSSVQHRSHLFVPRRCAATSSARSNHRHDHSCSSLK